MRLPVALAGLWHLTIFRLRVLMDRLRDSSIADDEQPKRGSPYRIFRRRSYPGSRTRRYEIHAPAGYTGETPLPLVMVLHGCRQRSTDIRAISNFDTIADRENFIVVYPDVTGYSGIRMRNCWGWWLEQEIRPGAGEVEDLCRIAEEVQAEFPIDPRRVHVAGLSSGGGMAVALMVANANRIASGAVVAGVPYSETSRAIASGPNTEARFKAANEVADSMDAVMGNWKRPIPIFIVHSRDDPIVDIQAAENIRDSWAHCFEIDMAKRSIRRSGNTDGLHWTHSKYRGENKRTVIETLFTTGGGHGWLGGNPGEFSNPAGPNATRLIWRFFKDHPIDEPTSENWRQPRRYRAA